MRLLSLAISCPKFMSHVAFFGGRLDLAPGVTPRRVARRPRRTKELCSLLVSVFSSMDGLASSPAGPSPTARDRAETKRRFPQGHKPMTYGCVGNPPPTKSSG